jgi:hypothetical protein
MYPFLNRNLEDLNLYVSQYSLYPCLATFISNLDLAGGGVGGRGLGHSRTIEVRILLQENFDKRDNL